MLSRRLRTVIGWLLFLVTSCVRPPLGEEWRDTSPHNVAFVTTNGLRLQYLDWGGTGKPIIFLHGFGDSPHYFDDIAPALSRQHRVLALARRGHGQSERPTMRFTIDDLAADVVQFMDSLKIGTAILVGFSFGGNEVTRIAERNSERVDRVIYLDGTFDDTLPRDSIPPTADPSPADLASLDAFRRFAQRVWYPHVPWTSTLETVLRDSDRGRCRWDCARSFK